MRRAGAVAVAVALVAFAFGDARELDAVAEGRTGFGRLAAASFGAEE